MANNNDASIPPQQRKAQQDDGKLGLAPPPLPSHPLIHHALSIRNMAGMKGAEAMAQLRIREVLPAS